ncbi:MAG TPA: tRNA preQ1(34) S-adenosylmethionine ribosyltransferase-isomerase QueA, partial [Chloroflexota bacterium]|nr:tRNA preQ1(34) S-adenosylmethionine ribosyltransferase-isomerase QueA [Chloroflexota bacterium]
MQTADYDYHLPEELIAQKPLVQRDECRLLTLGRASGAIGHYYFRDLLTLLRPGDLLVVNDTRVLPARLFGRKATGGRVEVLLIRRRGGDTWDALTRPGMAVGATIHFPDDLVASVRECLPDGQRVLQFNRADAALDNALHALGQLPIPPYVKTRLARPDDYQTVYAREEGSVAAPTAGLHFTPDLLDRLAERGIERVALTLHVGIGTFRPVKVEDPARHQMHSEWYRLTPEVAAAINRAKDQGRRVITVGTTVVRTLEWIADENGRVSAGEGETALFIRPGYRFRCISALITNFHLPRSTLLMLVSAFAGRESILQAYAEAVRLGYRFYSF